jgi:iron complex transport system substrate-binding protein
LEKILSGDRKIRKQGEAIGAFAALGVLLAGMAAIAAAQSSAPSSEITTTEAHAATTAPAAAKPASMRTVVDDDGRKVVIPADVRRVVSVAPNLTETIYALGLEEKLVGDTDYCDTPPAAKLKPHVGGPMNPNLESIVALHPDLVLASAINQWDTEHALEHLGIPVYGSDPQTVEGMLASTQRISEILGAGEKGAALTAQLQARLDALHAKLADQPLVHVLFVVWMDPLITIGQNTFISDALRWAGAESVVISDQKWPHVSFEEIVRVQPEYIVLTPDHQESNAAGLADLRSRAGWRDLEAVEMGHVINISPDINRPSPGMIDAIEQAARILHPEAFASYKANTVAQMDLHSKPDLPAKQHANVKKECAACGH